MNALMLQTVDELHGGGVNLHSVFIENVVEHDVLAVSNATDAFRFRVVGRVAEGDVNAPGFEEGLNALITRLAVDIGQVVAVMREFAEGLAISLFPLTQVFVEHLLPCLAVHQGGLGDHSVEVEDDCIK